MLAPVSTIDQNVYKLCKELTCIGTYYLQRVVRHPRGFTGIHKADCLDTTRSQQHERYLTGLK